MTEPTAKDVSLTLANPGRAAGSIVAVIIPALNEAGKIGRVLDKLPRDGRFTAIVVDDSSTITAHAPGAAGLQHRVVAARVGRVLAPELRSAAGIPNPS